MRQIPSLSRHSPSTLGRRLWELVLSSHHMGGLRPSGLAANTSTCWINLSAHHPPRLLTGTDQDKLIESNRGPLCKVLAYFCILKPLVSSDRFRTSGFTLKPLAHLGLIFVRSKRSVCPVSLIYTWISGFSRTIYWRGLSFNYFNFKLAYRVMGFMVESSYISVNVLRSPLFPPPAVSSPLP